MMNPAHRKLISTIASTVRKAGKPLGFTVSGVIPKGLEVRQFISITILASYLFVSVSPVLASDSLYFIHTDHLGSTVAITDEDGEVVSQRRYYPYGSDKYPVSSIQYPDSAEEDNITERKYTSQVKDSETNLYYYNARYYDPALGTFVSADPAGDSLNRFAYVGNNPIMAVDPSGHAAYAGGGGGGDRPGYPPYLPTILRTDDVSIWDREIGFFNNWTASEIAQDFLSKEWQAIKEEDWINTLNQVRWTLATSYMAGVTGEAISRGVAGWRAGRAAVSQGSPTGPNELVEAQGVLRQRYNLPPREMRFAEPLEYERRLLKLAGNEGITVRPTYECQPFFNQHSLAGAAHFDDGVVAYNVGLDPIKRTGQLEHELIHAFQAIHYQGMPVEIMEAQAYLAGASPSYLAGEPRAVDTLLMMIGMSVSVGKAAR